MKVKLERIRGFTLVELLVVISIIAVLASVAIPAFTGAQRNAKVNAASSTARGIYLGLLNYAGDHDGSYPLAENNANQAYKQLIPDYLDNEKPFYVAGCPWHAANQGKQPEDIGTAPDYTQALERGENHWAYISGLTNTSSASLPIVADGFTESVGSYTDNPTKKGGVWRGDKAIVVYLDGSVKAEALDPKTFKIMKPRGGQKVELFSSAWSDELQENNILNPEG